MRASDRAHRILQALAEAEGKPMTEVLERLAVEEEDRRFWRKQAAAVGETDLLADEEFLAWDAMPGPEQGEA